MRICRFMAVAGCLISMSVCAVGERGALAWEKPQPFHAGDRWGVLGDSITQGCYYSRYAELFYLTRFPEQNIEVMNCGIAGDTATGALRRLKWDCLDAKPTVVTVMFGMNDVGRDLYNGTSNSELENQRARHVEFYDRAMHQLTQRLLAAGVRVILIKPSIYDDTADLPKKNHPGCEAALAGFAHIVQAIADEYKVPTVDCNAPMAAINAEQQKLDPHFTIVGPSRIHPTLPGSFVMAYELIHAQFSSCMVSRIAIDAGADKAGRLENCEIRNLDAGTNSISFTCLEKGLPFPVEDGAKPALNYVPFTQELNQETLLVRGLARGDYQLSIDGKRICTFTAAQFADGVNLATQNTPQLEQSFRVLTALENKWGYVAKLRTIAFCEHFVWPGAEHPVNVTQMQEKIENRLRKTTNPWVISELNQYSQVKPQESELRHEADDAMRIARRAAQPEPHKFEILRVPAPAVHS